MQFSTLFALLFATTCAFAAPATTDNPTDVPVIVSSDLPSAKTVEIISIFYAYKDSQWTTVPKACTPVNPSLPKRFLCKTETQPLYMTWREFKEAHEQLKTRLPGRLAAYSWQVDNRLKDWSPVGDADYWTFELGDECLRKGMKASGHRCLVVQVKNAFE